VLEPDATLRWAGETDSTTLLAEGTMKYLLLLPVPPSAITVTGPLTAPAGTCATIVVSVALRMVARRSPAVPAKNTPALHAGHTDGHPREVAGRRWRRSCPAHRFPG